MSEVEKIHEEVITSAKSFDLYDYKGQKVAIGNLDYVGEKISVFTVSVFLSDDIIAPLRIESKINYAEVYSANINRIEHNRIVLESLRNISKDLQEDIKVEMQAEITMSLIDQYEQKRENEKINVNLMDISSGGVAFRTDKVLKVGSIVTMPLNILRLDFDGKLVILRREILGRNYKYGCRFTDLKTNEESVIRKAIYRLQIEESRGKGKR